MALRKRGSVFYADYYDAQGKRVVASLATKSPAEAQREYARLMADLGISRRPEPRGNMTLEGAVALFLEAKRTERPNTTTWTRYEQAIRALRNASPDLRTLADITPEAVARARGVWYRQWQELSARELRRGKSRINRVAPHGVNKIIRSIKTFVRDMEMRGLVPPQNWTAWDRMVKQYPTPKGRIVWLEKADIEALDAKASSFFKTILNVYYMAGLRPSEGRWLPWSNVDFERRKIHIRPVTDPETGETWTPKAYHCRSIDMWPKLYDFLKRLREMNPSDHWVITYDRGKRMQTEALGKVWSAFALENGLKDGKHILYVLRHSFATHLVSNNADLRWLQGQMGHSSYTQTETYAKLIPGHMTDATRRAIDAASA